MSYLPLILSAKREDWRMNDANSEDADAEFKTVKRKVRERDQHRCRFCGFKQVKADYYMQVHHRNDDHHDNRPENLVTACMHCHAVQHIGLWGLQGEAVLVYLPEVDQFALNHFLRTIMVAQRFADKLAADAKVPAKGSSPKQIGERLRGARKMAEQAQSLFDRIRACEADAQKRLGTSNPADVATAMLQMPDEAYAERHRFLAPYRLLLLGHHHPGGRQVHPHDKMPEIVDGWLAEGGPFRGIDPSTWKDLLPKVALPSGR